MATVFPGTSTLKPDLIKRIEAMSEEVLQLVNQVLLHPEKDRLWRESSSEAEGERVSGKLDRLPRIIPEVRSQRACREKYGKSMPGISKSKSAVFSRIRGIYSYSLDSGSG